MTDSLSRKVIETTLEHLEKERKIRDGADDRNLVKKASDETRSYIEKIRNIGMKREEHSEDE